MHIFRHIFLSNYWWQKSDIWSQASYRYPILWEAFLDPSDSCFLFAEERGYPRWALAHSSSCFIYITFLYNFIHSTELKSIRNCDIYEEYWIESCLGRGHRDRGHMVVGFTSTHESSANHHYSCEFKSRSWRGVLDTKVWDKVCQWLCQWFSSGTPVTSSNKNDCHDIQVAEIVLNMTATIYR